MCVALIRIHRIFVMNIYIFFSSFLLLLLAAARFFLAKVFTVVAIILYILLSDNSISFTRINVRYFHTVAILYCLSVYLCVRFQNTPNVARVYRIYVQIVARTWKWSKGRRKKRRQCPTAMSNCIVYTSESKFETKRDHIQHTIFFFYIKSTNRTVYEYRLLNYFQCSTDSDTAK